jgi:hypothetical protein
LIIGDLEIITFQVKIEDDNVLVELPSVEEVDAILGTNGLRVNKSDCVNLAEDAIKVQLAKEAGTAPKKSTTALFSKPEDTL